MVSSSTNSIQTLLKTRNFVIVIVRGLCFNTFLDVQRKNNCVLRGSKCSPRGKGTRSLSPPFPAIHNADKKGLADRAILSAKAVSTDRFSAVFARVSFRRSRSVIRPSQLCSLICCWAFARDFLVKDELP